MSWCAVGSIIHPSVEIRNITGVGDFGCTLDLKQIFSYIPHAYVNKEKKKRCDSKQYKKRLVANASSTRSQLLKPTKKNKQKTQQLSKSEREALLKKQRERLPIEAKYDPERFNGLILRILHPVKATVLLFRTGKVVCIGTKSLKELAEAGRYFTHILFMHGYQPVFSGFIVKNLVSSWTHSCRLNIEQLHNEHGGVYEPENFPALQHYIHNVTLLIFTSGKIVATGAKTQEELNAAHRDISSMLYSGMYNRK